MSGWLLGLVGVIYFGVAYGFVRDGHPGAAFAFLCYAGANAGFIYDIVKGGTCAL